MALDAADLEALGGFIEKKVSGLLGDFKKAEAVETEANAVISRVAKVGTPDVDPEAGPVFYVHLADGSVVESKDSASTHMDVGGTAVAVIGRYQKGE